MDKQRLKREIKSNLPHGKIGQIAAAAGVSRRTVTRVINGDTVNETVLKELYKACKTNIEYKAKLAKLINL